MTIKRKTLSSPLATGNAGGLFEAHVQASFVTLMLTGGYAPCLPCWPIKEINLQGKIDGFDTDDLIVCVENPVSGERRKLLGQIKRSIAISEKNDTFGDVIQAAWNDFNNSKIFSKNKDIIALITGPLSATDTHNVQWLLSQARHTKEADEFFGRVERAIFSPPKSEEKLAAIRHHLRSANEGNDVPEDELYSFLRHFHILDYDLGEEEGVVLSLLQSHISQFHQQYPHRIWSRVVNFVQVYNKDAGTITPDNLPEDLVEVFEKRAITEIPKELITTKQASEITDWSKHPHATDLALANLVGAWNEKNKFDVAVLAEMLGTDYDTWIQKARELLHDPDSPLSLNNGYWKTVDRLGLWAFLGPRLLDQNLDTFKALVVAVLTDRDPSFDLPAEKRFTASIQGKVLAHSSNLRNGLAEGLAILGSYPDVCGHCSQGKAEATAILAIREIFTNADWVLWGSLNRQLPALAEAAPDQFLDAVESALQLSPCPFDQLFAEEGDGIFGDNYLTGLFWALEGLAWDEEHLVRVSVVLGELAAHDPGGQWANRPNNSLFSILLPWFPQTRASIEKRKVAVITLCREWPEIGWELLICLLPNQHQTSLGSHKPLWRNPISGDPEIVVPSPDYWDVVSYYAELAVSMAGKNLDKLTELIDHFNNLPRPSFDELIKILSSDAISELSEDKRTRLWDRLTKFTSNHRRYSSADWALSDELLSQIEEVADKLAPSDPLNLYQPLFSNNDFGFYEENDNWEVQREKLDERRQNAMTHILEIGGIEAVIQFAETVESPNKAGNALGSISETETDKSLLPVYLNSAGPNLFSFISGYIWRRHYIGGWSWVDKTYKSSWDSEQVCQLLIHLPFTQETWERASKWLGDNQDTYWLKTNGNPYQTDGDLTYAIDKLIEHGRPYAAIDCLFRMYYAGLQISIDQCVTALITALTSPEPDQLMDSYHIAELIKMLQEDQNVSEADLYRIEWAYLPLLDLQQGAAPIYLENRLASDPDYFSELIRLCYRSKKEEAPSPEPTADSRAVATNAWRLLRVWRKPPGIYEDGVFNEKQFSSWIQRVKEISTETGHVEFSLNNIGKVLIHSPADPDGLWIHRTVAEELNARNNDVMRGGYWTGWYNSRDTHFIDPTGKPEKILAEQFRQKAEDVENAGFQRLAVSLRGLADSYDREAELNIYEHRRENEE